MPVDPPTGGDVIVRRGIARFAGAGGGESASLAGWVLVDAEVASSPCGASIASVGISIEGPAPGVVALCAAIWRLYLGLGVAAPFPDFFPPFFAISPPTTPTLFVPQNAQTPSHQYGGSAIVESFAATLRSSRRGEDP
jgi:hypothetical protein